jgi:TRAP-type uncharacterized transport system fused permease subunit
MDFSAMDFVYIAPPCPASRPPADRQCASRFGWSAYIVPFLFVSSPTLLMQGPPLDVVLAALTAVMGVYLVSVAVAGFMTRPVGLGLRIAFALAGLAMMVPARAFPGAIWTDVAGFVAGLVLIASQLDAVRNLHPALRRKT